MEKKIRLLKAKKAANKGIKKGGRWSGGVRMEREGGGYHQLPPLSPSVYCLFFGLGAELWSVGMKNTLMPVEV